MYRCGKCGRIATLEELLERSRGKAKCPECQFKILVKVRQRPVKRMKAI